MSLLDRLRAQRKPAADKPPAGESGRGQAAFKSGIVHPDDHNYNLTGRTGVIEFDRMARSDPDAKKALLMIVNAIAGATLTIEPAGGDDATDEDRKVAEFVEWALHEAMRPRLQSHVYTALTVALRNGRAPFEKTYRRDTWDGRAVLVLDELGLRRPSSIVYWHQDEYGRLTEIEQLAGGRILKIPARSLVLYRAGAEGDNWEGESILRSAYKPFQYVEKLELIDAMGHERFAMGIPVAYPPKAATDGQLDQVEEALANIRAGEAGYILAPGPKQEYAPDGDGWLFEILSSASSSASGQSRVVESINMHRQRIAASVVEEFMKLGQDGVGARATADVQQDPFLAFCEALCGLLIEDPINEQVIPELVAYNFEGVTECPRLSASLIDSTSLADLASFIQGLASAGALHPDTPLEDYLRERADLPPADPEEREKREEQAEAEAKRAEEMHGAEVAVAGAKAAMQQAEPDPEKKLALRTDRPLRMWEAAMSLDRIESALDTARDRFVEATADPTQRLAAELAAQTNPRAPKTPDPDLLAAVHGELRRLYELGQQTVREELDAQMGLRTFTLETAEADPAELAARSAIAVENITASMLIDLRRANTAPLVRDRTAQAMLQAAAEAGARKAAREEALNNAGAVINLGRRNVAEANRARIKGARYTSILDNSRCAACREADDDILRPLDDPVRLSRIPPNPACSGKQRCRCLEWFQLTDQAPMYAG